MRLASFRALGVVLAIWVAMASSSVAAGPSADPFASSFVSSQEGAGAWRENALVEGIATIQNIGFNPNPATHSFRICRNGDLFRLDNATTVHDIPSGKEFSRATLDLFGSDFYADGIRKSDQDDLRVMIHDQTSPGGTKHISRKDSLVASLDTGAFLDGVMQGTDGSALGALVQQASRVDRLPDQTIRDTPCHVLEAQTVFGSLQLWISEHHGSSVVRSVLTRSPEDKYDDSTLHEMGLVRSQTIVEVLEFVNIDGVWIPKRGTYDQTVTESSGRETGLHVDVERTKIEIAPEFDSMGVFTPVFPEGTYVSYASSPSLVHRVQNGNLIPYVDLGQIDALDDACRVAFESPVVGESSEIADVPDTTPERAEADEDAGNAGASLGHKLKVPGIFGAIVLATAGVLAAIRSRMRRAQ